MKINLLRYGGIYIAVVLALALGSWALEHFAGTGLPTGLSTILPPIVASMSEGQFAVRRLRAPVPGNEAWRAAVKMTIVVAVLNVAILGVILALEPGVGQIGIGLLGGIFAVLLLAVFFVNRVFFGIGARSELKAIAAREARK